MRQLDIDIARLPGPAATRLMGLREKAMLALAPMQELARRIREARELVLADETLLKQMARPAPRLVEGNVAGSFGHVRTSVVKAPSDTDPQVVEVNNRIDRHRQEIERLEQLSETHRVPWEAYGSLQRNVERYLTHECAGIAIAVHEVEVELPALLKNEDLPGLVERLRRRGRELQSDRMKVVAAPIPSAVAKAMVKVYIEQLGERGGPDLMALIDRGDIAGLKAATRTVHQTGYVAAGKGLQAGVAQIAIGVDDVISFMSWFAKDALLKRINQEIDQVANDSEALDDTQRAELLAQADRDALECQRQECAAIELAEQKGTVILPRPKVDPRAWLGLADTLPVPPE
jgi:hypothetical protein